MSLHRSVAAAVFGSLFAGSVVGQTCVVNNPSFEVGSSGLGGWNYFSFVGVSAETELFSHGRRALSIGVPGGPSAEAGAWQFREAGPGTVFQGAIRVGHPEGDPLTGEARGVVDIEWRDSADQLISFDRFEVLTPADPMGRMLVRVYGTPPAPPGTASARLVLRAVANAAGDAGRVVYDAVELTEPDFDAIQWNDFPGGRSVGFAGYSWRVKGPGFYGPGPNVFSDSSDNVSVTADGLELAISGAPGGWASSEVVIEEPLGYGDYVFTTAGRADDIADNVVLGLFLWQYPRCFDPDNLWNQHNEIDVEISRWGDPNNSNAQFVTQPFYEPENIERFDIEYTSDDELVSYAFNWLPGRIEYRAWRGGPDDETPQSTIRSWTYADDHLPTPEQPRVHINLWYFGSGPADNQPQSATIADFRFRAMGDADRTGGLDFFDVATFHDRLAEGDAAADVDNDGEFDARDHWLFLTDGFGF